MKKLTALLLSLLMLLSLGSCGAAPSGEDTPEVSTELTELTDSSADASQSDAADESLPDTADASWGDGSSWTEGDGSDIQTIDVPDPGDYEIDEEGTYTSSQDVALYIATYEHLPENFMTKEEARDLGWEGGGLDGYAYGMCIGGDRFSNREGQLPKKKGRTYTECDINTLHAKKRGAERLVFSNDGLIYYTDDHYETFTLIYGEE